MTLAPMYLRRPRGSGRSRYFACGRYLLGSSVANSSRGSVVSAMPIASFLPSCSSRRPLAGKRPRARPWCRARVSLHLLAALLYPHPAPARVGDGFHWDHEVLLAQSQKASHPDVQKAHVSLFRVEVEVLHGPYLLPIPIVDVAVERSLGSRVAGKIRVSKLDECHRAKTSFAGRQSPIFPMTRSLVSKYLFDL